MSAIFHFLRQNVFDAGPFIEIVGHTPDTADLPWVQGTRFDPPPQPLVLELDPSYGSDFPDFFDTTVPVMSNRLLALLRGLAIDNIDAFPVQLHHPGTGELVTGWQAVNVIGNVDAADLSQSEYRLVLGDPHFTGRIVIDAARTGGLPLFRLENGPGFLVCTVSVAQAVKAAGLKAVLLQPTEAYEGA